MVYAQFIKTIRQTSPLIHVLTNNVTNLFVADVLLAMGCRPIMAFDPLEVAGITTLSDALCINTGTPLPLLKKSYKLSLKVAAEKNIPVALDFPAVGVSTLRQKIAYSLFPLLERGGEKREWPRIIRGNASEMFCLADKKSHGGSIESIHSPQEIHEKIGSLFQYAPALCISGKDNYILGSQYQGFRKDMKTRIIPGGSPLMAKISGFGCVSTALMAAFLSTYPFIKSSQENTVNFSAEAAVAVCSLMVDASHLDSSLMKSAAPSQFKNHFIDHLYQISEKENLL